jgi:phosphate-starvation-inducible protein E
MALLAASAAVLLAGSAVAFVRGLLAGALASQVIGLLDRLLLILMIVELLYTVQVSFREHLLTAPPFLLVALIAGIRRILILTAEIHDVAAQGSDKFRNAMIELSILTAMSLVLVVCLSVLRNRPAPAEPAAEWK